MKRTISFLLSAILFLSVFSSVVPAAFAESVPQIEEENAETVAEAAAEAGEAIEEAPTEEGAIPDDEDAELVGTGGEKSVEEYSYEIKPLLAPFNTFFFVKTDNPDPRSFRFVDKDTIYSEDPESISFNYDRFYDKDILYADVKYENPETCRVNGGYIFKSDYYNTDGGSITLQKKLVTGDWYNSYTWEDTSVKLKLPKLKDNADYLIDTYKTGTSFFDNMDAIQNGFQKICMYSGSYVRGKLIKTDDYWFAAIAGHIDQSFYIYSPYEREDSRSLFATAIYPFRYDSLGFPGMMAEISKRLDSSSSYVWNSSYHWLIDVTYDGETRSYGGAGNITGKGISEDKIIKYFTFDKNDMSMTLENHYDLLVEYSKVVMEDDIPREDALTWRDICDTVGDGAWVRISNSAWKSDGRWDLSNQTYTYLYSRDSTDNISDSEWGVGYRNYHGGKMGYFTDTWVDGRYIGEWRHIVQGEKFEDHPNANIYVKNVTVPLIEIKYSYTYDYERQRYLTHFSAGEIKEEKKNVLFTYNSAEDNWTVSSGVFGYEYADYDDIKELIEEGELDEKYLDMITLTREEVEAMEVDKNTDYLPYKGYSYDGNSEPGTPFGFEYLIGDADGNGEIDVVDATLLQRYVAQIKTPYSEEELMRGDADRNGSIELPDATAIQYYSAGLKTDCSIGEKAAYTE